jgi:hypothetical protein
VKPRGAGGSRSAFAHMLHRPGWRAKDVQLLVASGSRGMCAGLVFLLLSHGPL